MTTPAQTLATTTASLLDSSWPFMLLSLIASVISALALVLAQEGLHTGKILHLSVMVLALPAAWLSMRVLLDLKIMTLWREQHSESAYRSFDESLLALGLIKYPSERDLKARAQGCLRLQKHLIILAAGQWLICVAGLACSGLI
ncbi:MAG TPA: hypothetical protein VIZ65_15915 [Cellvibrionaceae bacterium]